MSIKRRTVLTGSAAGVVSLTSGLAAPAIAQSDPIKIGYLPALTGPSSSTGVGINRGTQLAVEEINKAGGIKGRKIELITRDTQSDPTKAVNAVAELTQRAKASMIWGPVNSGEALAATPLIARDKVPMLHPCWVDELIDVKKYPMAFRIAPTNTQVGGGANHYVVDVLKLKKVAVVSDTTGYGTASANTYVPMLKAKGAEVVYTNHVDAANPDLKPELLRMQSAGAQAIMPWSVNAGFLSRILNTRGAMGWDVPVVGQTTLGSGQTKALLEKPENWNKVYSNNFRNCCYVNGKLPPRAADYVERLKKEKIEFADTLLWWVALGWDGAFMMADALKNAGTKNEDIVAYMNKVKDWPGIYGTVTWTPEQHNGFPDQEVVMCEVNSLRDGAFNIAPGYSS
ncbi:ABC transporter substrate-binding protein [Reyranella soli]|uniref:Branched-chain amino acid ABC transporter substrate-binding protein n=1 Tax=Reyranella soli TaxID=1230389 RepID=A0A512NLY0_9HYPH|nr:ABC transporter substrate-binding protein [Reyranella soli]GEP59963.1 branched-chain amino acid ABC transporter substrate-binding protein [Reyranella soli]